MIRAVTSIWESTGRALCLAGGIPAAWSTAHHILSNRVWIEEREGCLREDSAGRERPIICSDSGDRRSYEA